MRYRANFKTMPASMEEIKIMKIKKGTGYWDLTNFPWGGDFKRLSSDAEIEVEQVIDNYNSGEPRNVVAILNGKKSGFTL